MKVYKSMFVVVVLFCCLCLAGLSQAIAANAAFDLDKMSDMSDFDPNNPVIPTGDTIKVGVVNIFSGPGAGNGQIFWMTANWVAHDINKRGGILVDGKKKKIEMIKGDSKGKPADTKKVCEKLILQDGCKILTGTSGSHVSNIMAQVCKKYKVIHLLNLGMSNYLMDAKHFSRYSFQTFTRTSTMGYAGAYFYGKIRKKEKKFYILNQDYSFGHELAEMFKEGLKKYFPEAEIVGEDYHPLFAKDFAPYVTKIKASGAEVIFTGDWLPDGGNLLKTCRDMGVNLPILNIFVTDPNALAAVGIEGTKGLINLTHYAGSLGDPKRAKFFKIWDNLWRTKWEKPYNTWLYKVCGGTIADNIYTMYWLFSVVERAASLDPEKIIKVWEGDTYQSPSLLYTMRADDHTTYKDQPVTEFVPPEQQKISMTIPPYYWFNVCSNVGPITYIPAKYCIPTLDPKLKGRASK